MNFDRIIENLPLVGIFFERTYEFWRQNVLIANLTHIVFGIGITLVIFTQQKKIGWILILIAVIVHFVAFIF